MNRTPVSILIAAALFVCPPSSRAESQKEKEAAAQHLRDVVTIDRLVRENAAASLALKNAAANGVAIARLGVENKQRAAVASKESTTHAAEAHDAVAVVQEAAIGTQTAVEAIKVSNEKIQAKTELIQQKVELITPVTAPIWLAAIAAIVAVVGTVGSVVLAFINKGKLAEIHTLTNSNLAKITGELQIANERIAGLRETISLIKPSALPTVAPNPVSGA